MKIIKSMSMLILGAAIASCIYAQDDAARVLERARSFYEVNKYDSTIAVLQSWLKKNGKENATEYLVPLLMEALARKNDYRYFERLFVIYEQKFPHSDYMPRIFYLNGVVLSRQEKHEDAILSFSRALKSGAADPLDTLVLRNVKILCADMFTDAELGRLSSRNDLDESIAEIVAYFEFARLYDENKVDYARQKAEAFRKQYPGSVYDLFARDVIGKSRVVQKRQIPVGLLAPVSGFDADVGRQVVQAVQLAVEQHNENSGTQARLIIGDTEGKMLRTTQLTKDMVAVTKVPVIIGPVLSPDAIVCASMLLDKNVVMVTPTATDDGIARLGPNIFQINVTPGMLGKRIAAYAMENLNIRDFGVIAPRSEYGSVLAASFRREVENRGGVLVSEEFYEEGTRDFRAQFEALRSALLVRRQQGIAMGKGMDYASTSAARMIKTDSLRLADSALAIGGLFLPAESEDVVMLAPQAHFYRIQTQLLGSTGWHTSATLLDGKQYVNNAILSTNFETDAKDRQWADFSALYHKRFGAEPDRVAAPLAYDAARLVLMALEKCGDDAEAVAGYLHSVRGYQGVSGAISFGESDGANTEAAIVKIKDKAFIKIQ
jgi:ABC-type branched-subunit amino acid transport system substrate-binding protein